MSAGSARNVVLAQGGFAGGSGAVITEAAVRDQVTALFCVAA
jgi:hypothetical protein